MASHNPAMISDDDEPIVDVGAPVATSTPNVNRSMRLKQTSLLDEVLSGKREDVRPSKSYFMAVHLHRHYSEGFGKSFHHNGHFISTGIPGSY